MLNAIVQSIIKEAVAKYGLARWLDVVAGRACCNDLQLLLYSVEETLIQRRSTSEMEIVAGKSTNRTLHIVAVHRDQSGSAPVHFTQSRILLESIAARYDISSLSVRVGRARCSVCCPLDRQIHTAHNNRPDI